MIILFKDNKIIGADNNLLKILNADLNNLSNIISELELLISSRKNSSISLYNHQFKIEEIPLVSLENIKIFNLIQDTKSTQELSLENELLISPNLEENEIQIKQPFEETLTTNLEKNLIKEPVITEEEIKPVITEEEIKLSFEDNLDEINKILSLDKKEANQLIAEDLKKASQDLGIDYQMINDLYKDLLKQFKNEKKSLYEAIENQNYEKIHKIAHTLKGASLNLRLSNLALILKTLDEESKSHKPIEQIKFLVDKFYDFVNKIENKKEIPESIKNLILLTIKEYLATQNEKKFKKDLKYIEKLLNTKINSLEDLQELVKE